MSDTRALLVPAIILATGLVGGGWLLGDGLTRAKQADRAVMVRGLAERAFTVTPGLTRGPAFLDW